MIANREQCSHHATVGRYQKWTEIFSESDERQKISMAGKTLYLATGYFFPEC